MSYSKDLNWLSAPAFFLILAMLAIHSKKQSIRTRLPEKVKTEIPASVQKPS